MASGIGNAEACSHEPASRAVLSIVEARKTIKKTKCRLVDGLDAKILLQTCGCYLAGKESTLLLL